MRRDFRASPTPCPDENVLYADDARYAAFDQCEVRLYTDRYPDAGSRSFRGGMPRERGLRLVLEGSKPHQRERLHETTYTFTDAKGRTEDVEEEEK